MISFIIPAWKAEKYIDDCIESLINQTENYEIIIAVDGCRKTLQHLKKIKYKYEPELRILFLRKNKGTYIALNSAIKASKGDEIIIVGADDVLIEGAVSKIQSVKKDIVQFGYQNFKDGEPIKIGKKSGISAGAVYFKKDVFDKLNGFRDWQVAGDREFLTRAEKIIYIFILDEVIYFRRIHDNNITKNNKYGMSSDYRKELHKIIDETKKGKQFRLDEMIYQEPEEISQSEILVSVCIPLYKMSNIVDICFKGLCNQKADFAWEIIIAKDDDETIDINKWKSSLKLAGCKSIRLIEFGNKISLGKKMIVFSREAKGEVVVVQDGDDYSHCQRLSETKKAIIDKKNDFYNERFGLFYDFKSKKTICFDKKECKHPTGLNKAYSQKIFKSIPDEFEKKEKHIDFNLFQILKPKKIFTNNKFYSDSVFTDGFNKISLTRAKFYSNPVAPFSVTDIDAGIIVDRIKVNQEISSCYCLNMPDDGARKRNIQKEFNKLGLKLNIIVPPLPGDKELIECFEQTMASKIIKNPRKLIMEISNRLAFGRIIQKAQKNGDINIIIVEDDATFIKKGDEILRNILNQLPENFGVCFLGGYIREKMILNKISANLAEIKEECRIFGSHAVIINQSMFEYLEKRMREKVSKNTDTILTESIERSRCFISVPIIAWQNPGIQTVERIHKNMDLDYLRCQSEQYLEKSLLME